ncbi:MAG: hypothetical protein DRK00_00150 [Thermoprotei archaeon]|nr:MAG: hypothetical protein DRK00_00150 [Thermoprotei archaeon]
MKNGRLTQALYDALLEISRSGRDELVPTLSYSAGIIYPDILKIARKYGFRETRILDSLVELGVLKKSPYDSFVTCPKCGTFRLLSKLQCPRCGSKNLKRTTLVSHISCGYTGPLEEMASGEKYICKKCGKPLGKEGEGYIVLGRLFTCEDCGARFDAPLPAYKCISCGLEFDYRNANYVVIYKYEINKNALKQKAKQLLINLVEKAAQAEGLVAKSPAQAPGKSGYSHPVDVEVTDGRDRIYVDVVHDSATAMSEALAAIGKGSDMAANLHVILAPSEIAKRTLGGGDNFKAMSYDSAEEAYTKLKQLFREYFKRGGRR